MTLYILIRKHHLRAINTLTCAVTRLSVSSLETIFFSCGSWNRLHAQVKVQSAFGPQGVVLPREKVRLQVVPPFPQQSVRQEQRFCTRVGAAGFWACCFAGLDQECTSDHQCYCGEDCKEKIECAEGMCACKKGFKRYSTRCIVDPRVLDSGPQPSQANSFSVHFVCRLLTMMLFVKIS